MPSALPDWLDASTARAEPVHAYRRDTADQLRAVLLDTATRGPATVVVDLTATRFCDSYGLRTLLRAHKLARADGGGLRLVTPADGVVPRIFALTCLDQLIPCFASLNEALAQAPAAANRHRDARGPDVDLPLMETAIHAGSEAEDRLPPEP